MNERFTTLDQVVKDICEIGGDDYDHKSYGKVLKVCVNTLRGFNLYSSTPYVKTEEFEVMPNNTVLLPKNALDVVRVGKKDRCGEIEEIFYSKDLSMDAKNIEEHCQCSGKVQVIETIETGIGDTLCNYVVEGIDLGSETLCNYSLQGNNLDGLWLKYTFVDTITYENSWDDNGYGDIALSIYRIGFTEIYVLKGEDLDAMASISGTTYTINTNDILSYFYNQYLLNSNPNKPLMIIEDNIMYFKYLGGVNTEYNMLIIRNKSIIRNPSNLADWFSVETLSINRLLNVFDSDYILFSWNPQDITVELFINVNGNYEKVLFDENYYWESLNSSDNITDYYFYNVGTSQIIEEGTVNASCEVVNPKTFEVNINGEWVDETSNVDNGTWSLNNTTDEVTAWRYKDSEGEPSEPTPIEGVCRVDLQRQEVSKWVDNNIECDTNGRCKSCGNFVPTYSTAWYGGWYSSAPIYSRQLAQSNLNLPNSGQAYYEQYTARPYPARWGFYNLDLAKGVMRLTHNFEHGEKVVIIYSTDMVEIEGAKVVAVEWFDMLLYRCKELIWNRNSVDGTRQRQLYEREYTRIKKIYNKTTHEEWRRAIMKVKYSGVKR